MTNKIISEKLLFIWLIQRLAAMLLAHKIHKYVKRKIKELVECENLFSQVLAGTFAPVNREPIHAVIKLFKCVASPLSIYAAPFHSAAK